MVLALLLAMNISNLIAGNPFYIDLLINGSQGEVVTIRSYVYDGLDLYSTSWKNEKNFTLEEGINKIRIKDYIKDGVEGKARVKVWINNKYYVKDVFIEKRKDYSNAILILISLILAVFLFMRFP